LVVFLLISGSLFSQEEGRTFQVGDVGPAGGIVFFDRGFTSDGWRFLEVSPPGADFEAAWSGRRQDVPGTSNALGSGRQNTRLIVEEMNRRGETQRAAQLAADLEINGFNDWFLPSLEELSQLYINRAVVSGLHNAIYWSSSQHNRMSARSVDFGWSGARTHNSKFDVRRVRPVRAF